MAETALTFLLGELRDTLKWYRNLLSGSEDDFRYLNSDLNIMKAFLSDAGDGRNEKMFKEIERQIRDVVYVVEDTIDKCLTAKAKGAIRGLSKTFSLADEVRSFRQEKVKPVLDLVKANYATFAGAGNAAAAEEQPPSRHRKV